MKNKDNNSNNIQPATDWLLEEWPILKTQIPPRIIEKSKQIEKNNLMKFLFWLEKNGYNLDFEWDSSVIDDFYENK